MTKDKFKHTGKYPSSVHIVLYQNRSRTHELRKKIVLVFFIYVLKAFADESEMSANKEVSEFYIVSFFKQITHS